MKAASAFRFRPAVFAASAGLIAVLMLAIVTIPQTLSRHARLDVLRDHVGEVARLAASTIDGDLHRQLIEGADADVATRMRALRPLLRLHSAWPEAFYVYTMGERDGRVFFVLDTAQDPAFAQQRQLRASAYLEPFKLRSEYASNWLSELQAGRTFVNRDFQHDDYGFFMTGHAPIRDSVGQTAGFVGVDFDLNYYLGEEARFRRIELASILSALALSLILGYVYARYHFAQQAQMQQHYEFSMQDSLTGLPNRRGALAAIDAAWAVPGARSHATLLVDIDHFKSINDTHGHAAGDAVIQTLATALRSCLRPGDVAARLGGDEFLIFARNCDLVAAEQLAQRLLATVRATASGAVSFAVSIGISAAAVADASFDALYRRADTALYRAKAHGKNRHAVYDEAMDGASAS
jgi:diguanylate cyclase (GGDEF)-like protein